jgi:hypothetical protein
MVGSTPKPETDAGGEATSKVCGVGVARLLDADLTDR